MVSINEKRVESLIELFRIEIDSQHKKSFEGFSRILECNELDDDEIIFVWKIKCFFQNLNLVSISSKDIEEAINYIGEITNKRKIQFSEDGTERTLKDEILRILDYTGKRNLFYPKYFQKLGIKSCIYCNSQFTLSIEKSDNPLEASENIYSAKFQVDHYFAKSKYPYLSIALFNLYPVCASCNLIKGKKEIDFKLYSENPNINLIQFKIDKASKSKFLITRDLNDLKIIFIKNGDKNYDKIFQITEIYETQKDIAEEILLKALAYNKPYRNDLKNIFGKHRINDSLINRFILGNYTEPDEVHKRPMSKFMQDLGREAGLIE